MNIFILVIFLWLQSTTCHANHINLPKDASGWTIFSPSTDSKIAYVSEDGDDTLAAANGVYTVNTHPDWEHPFNPTGTIQTFATYAAASAAVGGAAPNWILFKRGESFVMSTLLPNNGRSATEPFLVGAYGSSGPSPVIKHGASKGLEIARTSPSSPSEARYIAVSSLSFYAHTRDPGNTNEFVSTEGLPGFELNSYNTGNSVNSILIEGCEFSYSLGNAVQSGAGSTIYDITLRRNKILSNYPVSGHCQGLWATGVDGFVLEENIFDHNGWYSKPGGEGVGVGTIFNHNTYFAGVNNATLRNNIFMRGSNMNNKFTSPDGNSNNITIEGNLYVGGHIGIGIGTNYMDIPERFQNVVIKDNVLTNLGMDNVTGQGIAWYMQISGWREGVVSGNLLMNQIGNIDGGTMGFHIYNDAKNTRVVGNVVWRMEDDVTHIVYDESAGASYVFSSNKISLPGDKIFFFSLTGTQVFSENKYYSPSGSLSGWTLDGVDGSFSNFSDSVGDSSSTFDKIEFPDSNRSVETYMASLGETATIDAFIEKARAQDRYNWDTRFTAEATNAWIKSGFGMGQRRFFRNVRIGEVEQ